MVPHDERQAKKMEAIFATPSAGETGVTLGKVSHSFLPQLFCHGTEVLLGEEAGLKDNELHGSAYES